MWSPLQTGLWADCPNALPGYSTLHCDLQQLLTQVVLVKHGLQFRVKKILARPSLFWLISTSAMITSRVYSNGCPWMFLAYRTSFMEAGCEVWCPSLLAELHVLTLNYTNQGNLTAAASVNEFADVTSPDVVCGVMLWVISCWVCERRTNYHNYHNIQALKPGCGWILVVFSKQHLYFTLQQLCNMIRTILPTHSSPI